MLSFMHELIEVRCSMEPNDQKINNVWIELIKFYTNKFVISFIKMLELFNKIVDVSLSD